FLPLVVFLLFFVHFGLSCAWQPDFSKALWPENEVCAGSSQRCGNQQEQQADQYREVFIHLEILCAEYVNHFPCPNASYCKGNYRYERGKQEHKQIRRKLAIEPQRI